MKAFKAEVVQQVQMDNPKAGEYPTAYFPPPKNIQETMNLRDQNKKNAWLSATRKELKQLIDSDTFNASVKPHPDEPVIPITETNKIKLNKDGNLDKLKVRLCIRGDIQKKLTPNCHSVVVNTQCVIVIPTLPQYTLQKEHVTNHQSQEKTANRIKIKADQDGSRWIKMVQE